MIPQQQVPGILALQAGAAGVPQVGHALAAQRVAVWRKQGIRDMVTTDGWDRTALGQHVADNSRKTLGT